MFHGTYDLLRILPPCQDSVIGHLFHVAVDCLVVDADVLHLAILGVVGLESECFDGGSSDDIVRTGWQTPVTRPSVERLQDRHLRLNNHGRFRRRHDGCFPIVPHAYHGAGHDGGNDDRSQHQPRN